MSGGGADEGGRTWSRHCRRPYTVTGGRTRPAHDDLELETLVQTVTGIDEQLAGLGREQRSIAALCREAVSVAEISGRLDLLVGVTRVIVGDMALQGVVVLYRPQATVADADLPPVELLERGAAWPQEHLVVVRGREFSGVAVRVRAPATSYPRQRVAQGGHHDPAAHHHPAPQRPPFRDPSEPGPAPPGRRRSRRALVTARRQRAEAGSSR